jgi:hypothetical protein
MNSEDTSTELASASPSRRLSTASSLTVIPSPTPSISYSTASTLQNVQHMPNQLDTASPSPTRADDLSSTSRDEDMNRPGPREPYRVHTWVDDATCDRHERSYKELGKALRKEQAFLKEQARRKEQADRKEQALRKEQADSQASRDPHDLTNLRRACTSVMWIRGPPKSPTDDRGNFKVSSYGCPYYDPGLGNTCPSARNIRHNTLHHRAATHFAGALNRTANIPDLESLDVAVEGIVAGHKETKSGTSLEVLETWAFPPSETVAKMEYGVHVQISDNRHVISLAYEEWRRSFPQTVTSDSE